MAFRKLKPSDDKAYSYDADQYGVLMFIVNLEVLVFAPRTGHMLSKSR